MRKSLFFLLVGIVSGIYIFTLSENIKYSLLGISIFILLIYLSYKKTIFFLFPGLLSGLLLANLNFNSYKLINENSGQLELTIIEKKSSKDNNKYIVRAYDLDRNIEEKSIFYSQEKFNIGDRLLAKADIGLANKNTNPNLFNFRNYLLSKNIKSQLKINQIYKKSKSKKINLLIKDRFYNYIHDIFENNLDEEVSDFVISLVLGENLIENDDIKDLGLFHILAVSGLHIDILLSFIIFAFNKLNLNYRYSRLLGLSLCLAYGYMISFPFSVIRVLIINIISYLAFIFKKPEDKIKSLIIAAIFILIINPFAILNSGFILSFVATSSIYLIYPKIKRIFRGIKFYKEISFIVAIQLGLFAFLVYYNGNINLISIVANFLIIPIFEISMYLIFGLVILYPIGGGLLSLAFKLINSLVYIILGLTKFLGQFKIFNFSFKHDSIFISVFLFIMLVIILNNKNRNLRLNKIYYGFNFLILLSLISLNLIKNEVTFSMIDIGQGDAFILNDDGKYYLFDVGGPKYDKYDSGERVMLPLLKSFGIKEIEGVFISHMDLDHAGNLDLINRNFKINKVLSSKINEKALSNYDFIGLNNSDKIKLKNGYIEVVFDGVEDGDENNKSLGLIINLKDTTILSLGDLEGKYEDKIDRKSDILKVSHHGSRFSTSKNFVNQVNPKIALISAGRNNSYGHPAKEVLDNLSEKKSL